MEQRNLNLFLFGHFQATTRDGLTPHFATHKAQALLAYLAAEAAWPHSRDALAGLLWPDWPQQSALTNLRSALASLRRAIGDQAARPPFLTISRETIQFNQDSNHWLDVADFLLSIGLQPSAHYLQALRSAAALYRGPFLHDFADIGSVPFEEWVLIEREQLQQQMLSALRNLADYYELQGEYQSAQACARQQIEIEPWQEEAHRQLIRLLALDGQRSLALAQYETCQRLLAKELGVEPAAETSRLYEQIRCGGNLQAFERLKVDSFARSETPASSVFARQAELGKLDRMLKKALAGQGQVCLVVGEPGSGKTALVGEFVRRVLGPVPNLIVASGKCTAYTGIGDPYLPFLEILSMLTGDLESHLSAGSISREHAQRLYNAIPEAVQAIIQHAPDLINRFVPAKALLTRLQAVHSSQTDRLERTLESMGGEVGGANVWQSDLCEQFTHVLQDLALRYPILLVIDDLQWADEASLNLLAHLGRRLAGQRILILGAYRPAEVAQGRNGGQHPFEPVLQEFQSAFGDLFVDLDQAAGKEFIDCLLDSEPNDLGSAFRDMLYRHTHGQALFSIEFLRGLQEHGDLIRNAIGRWVEGSLLNWDSLPRRVEAVIAERIARLPQAWQRLLSIASVEGEEFSAQLVAQVQGVSEAETLQFLDGPLSRQQRLVSAQGFQSLGKRRIARYRFKHILFQKYLYSQLDPQERLRLHAAVGNALESLYAEQSGDQTSELVVRLAWHFESAGLVHKAIAYLKQAAEWSIRLSAYPEGTGYYRHALKLLETSPEKTNEGERLGQELGLQMGLAVTLVANRGYSDPQVGATYDRARQLCHHMGNLPQLVPALNGLGAYYSLQANYADALTVYQQLVSIAQASVDSSLQMVADWQMGYYHIATGQYAPGRIYLEKALTVYKPEKHHPELYFQEPGVSILTWLARGLWALGYPDQAEQRSQQALILAQERAHPFSLAFAHGLAASLYKFCWQVDRALVHAEAAIDVSTRYGFPVWIAFGKALRGWVLAQRGQFSEGMSEIRQGIGMLRSIGARQPLIGNLYIFSECLAHTGQWDESRQTLDEALELELTSGGEFNIPLLYILKGDLSLLQDYHSAKAEAEAADCFLHAIEVAGRQQAKSWELRAALRLHRLFEHQGREQETKQRLAGLYDWFSEGFDTPDLLETRHILGR